MVDVIINITYMYKLLNIKISWQLILLNIANYYQQDILSNKLPESSRLAMLPTMFGKSCKYEDIRILEHIGPNLCAEKYKNFQDFRFRENEEFILLC